MGLSNFTPEDDDDNTGGNNGAAADGVTESVIRMISENAGEYGRLY